MTSQHTYTARVYAIIAGQLMVLVSACVLFDLHPTLARIMDKHLSFFQVAPLWSLLGNILIWIYCTGGCSPDTRRNAPINWILLALFTSGGALSVGFWSKYYNVQSALAPALAATALAYSTVSAYTILQRNPKYDLSRWGAGILS